MDKRILIFSPELKDREDIAFFIKEYFKKNFRDYFNDLEIQNYFKFNEPPEIDRLGHWGERELFVVMDQRLGRSNSRFKEMRNNSSYKKSFEYHVFDLSKKLCDEKNIPYIFYEGEITKEEEFILTEKIDNVKDKIKNRLEGKVMPLTYRP